MNNSYPCNDIFILRLPLTWVLCSHFVCFGVEIWFERVRSQSLSSPGWCCGWQGHWESGRGWVDVHWTHWRGWRSVNLQHRQADRSKPGNGTGEMLHLSYIQTRLKQVNYFQRRYYLSPLWNLNQIFKTSFDFCFKSGNIPLDIVSKLSYRLVNVHKSNSLRTWWH